MRSPVILVGVDGSTGSATALRWALQEAELRDGVIQVVTAWPLRRAVDGACGVTTDVAERRHASELQRHVVEVVLRDTRARPAVSFKVVRGDPVDVLVRESKWADVLVVGTHDISSMRHAAAESVTQAVTQLACRPTVVVPRPFAGRRSSLDDLVRAATPELKATP